MKKILAIFMAMAMVFSLVAISATAQTDDSVLKFG